MNKNNRTYIRPDMQVVKLQQQGAMLINESEQAGAPSNTSVEEDE